VDDGTPAVTHPYGSARNSGIYAAFTLGALWEAITLCAPAHRRTFPRTKWRCVGEGTRTWTTGRVTASRLLERGEAMHEREGLPVGHRTDDGLARRSRSVLATVGSGAQPDVIANQSNDCRHHHPVVGPREFAVGHP
jgi:hypothetical protein